MVCDAAAVRSSTRSSIFQQMFFCELSMTLCLDYKIKCFEQSSYMIRDAIINKLSTCSLCWDPSDICTKMRTSGLNQMHQNKMFFLSICCDIRIQRNKVSSR